MRVKTTTEPIQPRPPEKASAKPGTDEWKEKLQSLGVRLRDRARLQEAAREPGKSIRTVEK